MMSAIPSRVGFFTLYMLSASPSKTLNHMILPPSKRHWTTHPSSAIGLDIWRSTNLWCCPTRMRHVSAAP